MYILYLNKKKKYWLKNGSHHRKFDKFLHRGGDKPAVIYYTGTMLWYYKGKPHRDNDLPALIFHNGDVEWYLNGIRYNHVKYKNGTKEWYDGWSNDTNGYRLHKEKGPAVVYANGDYEYWEKGKRHGITVCCGKQYLFDKGEFVKCIV